MLWQKIRSGFFFTTALVTCPCHLPLTLSLLLPLTAGTALGAFITENVVIVGAAFTLIFIASLALAFGSLTENRSVCERSTPQDESRPTSVRQPLVTQDPT